MTSPTPAPARRCPARAGAPARGMTLVEIIIVIALMGLVMAFAAPRLFAADALGADQQAKTTASGALDSVMAVYAQDVSRLGWDSQAVADKLAEYEPGGAQDPDGDGTTGTAASPGDPLVPPAGEALPHEPVHPDVTKTVLERANPDVAIAPTETQRMAAAAAAGLTDPSAVAAYRPTAAAAAQIPSTGVNLASVGTARSGTDAATYTWTVGVAVYARSGRDASTGTCWMAQRRMDGPPGPPVEAYYVFDVTGDNPADITPTAPDSDQCTGHVAARLDFAALSAGADPLAGRSWGFPLTVTAAAVTTAATAS